MPCCQFASDDEIETDPEPFQCETCPVAEALQELWPENVEAWRMFHQLAGRFIVDAAIGSVVFERLTRDLPVDEVELLTERLGLIYDVLMPPKQS